MRGKLAAYFCGIVGAGYVVMKVFTPSEADYWQSLPEERRRYARSKLSQENRNITTASSSDIPSTQKQKRMTQSEMIALMLKQNMESGRPAWDVRPVQLPNNKDSH